jgi:hypothetical protein
MEPEPRVLLPLKKETFAMKAVMKVLAVMIAYLGNFDVVNNSGEDAHGFEIQFEGINPNDVWAGWSYERYGAPDVVQTATGVTVRYTAPYDGAAQ